MAWGDAPYGALPPAGTEYAYVNADVVARSALLVGAAAFASPTVIVSAPIYAVPFGTPTVSVINNVTLELTSSIAPTAYSITTFAPWAPAYVLSVNGSLITTTPLTPGGVYTLIVTILGADILITFSVSAGVEDVDGSIVAQKMPRQWGVLETLTWAISQELQFIGGRPTARTTVDFGPTEVYLQVNATEGFDESGYLLVEGLMLQYSSKTDTCFEVLPSFRGDFISAGTVVVSKTNEIAPRSMR